MLRGVGTAAALLFSASALSACGEEEAVEIACCQLLLYCESCGNCGSDSWTIASSGETKACKAHLDEKSNSCGSQYSPKDDAANACK